MSKSTLCSGSDWLKGRPAFLAIPLSLDFAFMVSGVDAAKRALVLLLRTLAEVYGCVAKKKRSRSQEQQGLQADGHRGERR